MYATPGVVAQLMSNEMDELGRVILLWIKNILSFPPNSKFVLLAETTVLMGAVQQAERVVPMQRRQDYVLTGFFGPYNTLYISLNGSIIAEGMFPSARTNLEQGNYVQGPVWPYRDFGK